MVLMGDELWRTQSGNNNAYCQDSTLTWVDWTALETDAEARSMLDFVRTIIALRKKHPLLRASEFLLGKATASADKDITWLRSDGTEMSGKDWENPERARIAFRLAATHDAKPLVVLMNGEPAAATFFVLGHVGFTVVLDTGAVSRVGQRLDVWASILLEPGALVVLVEEAVA
jgi:glycogen operon protein